MINTESIKSWAGNILSSGRESKDIIRIIENRMNKFNNIMIRLDNEEEDNTDIIICYGHSLDILRGILIDYKAMHETPLQAHAMPY